MDSFKLRVLDGIGAPGSCALRLSYKMQLSSDMLQDVIDELERDGYVFFIKNVKCYRLTDEAKAIVKARRKARLQEQTKVVAQ